MSRILGGERLTFDEARAVMTDVLAGAAYPAQLAGLLCVLRHRGESVEELAGFSSAMQEAATPLEGLEDSIRARLIDTCGTGGDRRGTINVSTAAALVAAGAGAQVCKHGNRAATSQTGSADVLEALGVAIDLDPSGVIECIEQTNIGFCFAPRYHPAMRFAGPVRKELGVPTAFNFLGPLVNPARVGRQVIGVSDSSAAELMLEVLRVNGASRAMVVYGHDGLDELTTTTTSTVLELRGGERFAYEVDPVSLAIPAASLEDLRGGSPSENADRLGGILSGERSAQSDIVCLNAAAALMVADEADSLEEGYERARSVIDDGSAAKALERLIEVSQSVAGRAPTT